MKKLKIKKTRPTFIISVLKVENYVVLVSLISNFLLIKLLWQINGWVLAAVIQLYKESKILKILKLWYFS